MTDLDKLTLSVAEHLAGRPVKIRWENPPTANAAGQVVKTPGGDLIIYVGNLTSADARLAVMAHELAHCRFDHIWMPVSTDHKRRPASIKQTPEVRERWRSNWREQRAKKQETAWIEYADRNAHKYFTGYQTPMECKLRALLSWEGE